MINFTPSLVLRLIRNVNNKVQSFILRSSKLCLYILAVALLLTPGKSHSQEAGITVTFPSDITVCGPAKSATVTLTALDTLTSITGVFDLSALPGFEIDPASFSSTNVMFISPDIFSFPDLLLGESASFAIDFLARCGSASLGNTNFIKIDFDYQIDGVNPGSAMGMSADPGFSVTQPGLDFILSGTDVFRPVVNEPDTIMKTIVNAGDGDIDSALYFVIDHPNLSLCEIYVKGLDGSFMPNGNSYMLDLAGTSADTLFYWIGADAIMTTGDLDATWDGLAGGQESFEIYEVWKGFDCPPAPVDLNRGIGYGCTMGDPLDLCTSQGNNSVVTFDRLPELVSGRYNWGDPNPACYADVNTEVGYFITNIGEAPAQDVIVNISTSAVGQILSYQFSVGSGGSGSYSMGDLSDNTIGCAGITSIEDTLTAIDLAVGDTIYLQVEMKFDCSCNVSSCGIAGIYQSNLNVDVIDRCGDAYAGLGSQWNDYGIAVAGFVEGPFDIKDGESGCVTYTITGYRNNWFNNAYPNSYYEMDFNFPAGLEIDNATVTWEDADGTIFTPSETSFIDGDPSMGDTIKVRWEQSSIPASWSAGSGDPNSDLF